MRKRYTTHILYALTILLLIGCRTSEEASKEGGEVNRGEGDVEVSQTTIEYYEEYYIENHFELGIPGLLMYDWLEKIHYEPKFYQEQVETFRTEHGDGTYTLIEKNESRNLYRLELKRPIEHESGDYDDVYFHEEVLALYSINDFLVIEYRTDDQEEKKFAIYDRDFRLYDYFVIPPELEIAGISMYQDSHLHLVIYFDDKVIGGYYGFDWHAHYHFEDRDLMKMAREDETESWSQHLVDYVHPHKFYQLPSGRIVDVQTMTREQLFYIDDVEFGASISKIEFAGGYVIGIDEKHYIVFIQPENQVFDIAYQDQMTEVLMGQRIYGGDLIESNRGNPMFIDSGTYELKEVMPSGQMEVVYHFDDEFLATLGFGSNDYSDMSEAVRDFKNCIVVTRGGELRRIDKSTNEVAVYQAAYFYYNPAIETYEYVDGGLVYTYDIALDRWFE